MGSSPFGLHVSIPERQHVRPRRSTEAANEASTSLRMTCRPIARRDASRCHPEEAWVQRSRNTSVTCETRLSSRAGAQADEGSTAAWDHPQFGLHVSIPERQHVRPQRRTEAANEASTPLRMTCRPIARRDASRCHPEEARAQRFRNTPVTCETRLSSGAGAQADEGSTAAWNNPQFGLHVSISERQHVRPQRRTEAANEASTPVGMTCRPIARRDASRCHPEEARAQRFRNTPVTCETRLSSRAGAQADEGSTAAWNNPQFGLHVSISERQHVRPQRRTEAAKDSSNPVGMTCITANANPWQPGFGWTGVVAYLKVGRTFLSARIRLSF